MDDIETLTSQVQARLDSEHRSAVSSESDYKVSLKMDEANKVCVVVVQNTSVDLHGNHINQSVVNLVMSELSQSAPDMAFEWDSCMRIFGMPRSFSVIEREF